MPPPMLPTTTSDLVSSVASQQVADLTQGFAISKPSIEQLRREKRQRRQWTIVVGSVAGVTVVMALTAMAIHASLICYLAFCLPLVLAPWSIMQRRLINKAPTIRGQVQLCRQNVARLIACNLQFAKENERLSRETQRLQRIQTQLAETVQTQGGNLHDLRILIKENSEIQKQIKGVQKAREVQKLLHAILAADTNRDFVLTEAEFERLIIRLHAFNIVGKQRIRAVTLRSSMGKSILSLYRDLQEEILKENDPTMTTLSRNANTRRDDSQAVCGEHDGSFMYQCMD